jgi:endo-1,4-beta-xylanase
MKSLAALALILSVQTSLAQDTRGLKDYYKSYFPVGVAVSPQVLAGPEADLIKKEFNSLTAENVMKMGPIHPEENRYNWDPADQIVNFALANNMKMRGHTLCWHNQTPAWIFKDNAGNQVSKEVLLQRLKDHITTVVSRYKGKIYAWDVVNEAIDDKDAVFYRPSPWYNIIGEEYIAKAFEYAHAADPDALLFYNDYNTESPSKRAKIIKLVKSLVDKGVPIHGIGIQGHWSIFGPNEDDVAQSIAEYSSLGLKLHVTELDVSVYTPEQGRRDKRPDEQDTFTPDMEQKQLELYSAIFRVFRDNKKSISAVTFWNVTDKRSWLDNFPVRGRKNYPLLFDKDLKPKKAYWEVVRMTE